MSEIVIARPDLQSPTQRLTSLLLTFALWGGWCYLTWPFAGICLMMLGVPVLSDELVAHYSQQLIPELAAIAHWCVLVVLASALAFPAWIEYHIVRFSKRTHRRQVARVDPTAVGRHFNVAENDVHFWQTAKRAKVEHCNGSPVAIAAA